jgi:hypothetical protein
MDPQNDQPHPKDRVPITEGIIRPAERPELINDQSPTETADPAAHGTDDVLPKRPTDGPL